MDNFYHPYSHSYYSRCGINFMKESFRRHELYKYLKLFGHLSENKKAKLKSNFYQKSHKNK